MPRKETVSKIPTIPKSKLSAKAETNLPDVLYVKEERILFDMPAWAVQNTPDAFSVRNEMVEVGVYTLVKVLKVSTVVRVTEDVLQ